MDPDTRGNTEANRGGEAAPEAPLRAGTELGAYRIDAPIGAGGMGEVYRARDRKLDRDVAIKTLPTAMSGDPEQLDRFRREARLLAALSHPGIGAIYGLEESAGRSFLVLELVEGETLAERLARSGPLPTVDALAIASGVADALEAAHARGITHRDIKPANIKITPQGTVKILDFGLARESRAAARERVHLMSTRSDTAAGLLLGTPPYMSPEQVRGGPVDHRSDIWAFGCVLFELLTGTRPFGGETISGTLAAILEREPDWNALPPATPSPVRRLVRRCLEKDRDRRYPSAAELKAEVNACHARLAAPGVRGWLRTPGVAIPALVLLVALVAAATWAIVQSRRQAWARGVALPEIARLLEREQVDAAFRLGQQVERFIPGDPQLLDFERQYATRVAIATTPPGADVYVKGYLAVDADWLHVGRAPLDGARVPQGYLRWRITRDGSAPLERAAFGLRPLQVSLQPPAETPAGMVRVPGGGFAFRDWASATLGDFWLDTYEVTNRQYKRFVDEGGYANRRFWTQPFVRSGAVLSWDDAMARLRDGTGRPGPSTWALGTYPDGQADHPVSGVSWYEAAAYAEFAGTRLPTVHQWLRAHAIPQASEILRVSNFGGRGTAAVGTHAGLSPYGNYDMAGNVREWCWNASGPDGGSTRYILGGSWSEPAYRFPGPHLLEPWDRSPGNGFRTARDDGTRSAALEAPVPPISSEPTRERPVTAEVFQVYRNFYAYERTGLAPVVEDVDDSPLHWRSERITFNAAYGGERVIAYLFLPRNAEPPYQTIVYFPSGVARQSRSRDEMGFEVRFVDFLPRTGRAVLFLVYKGTFERHLDHPATVPFWTRDLVIAWSRDFSRAIDYLQTRPDVDRANIGYFSLSNPLMPILSAIDGRIKAGAHVGTGLMSRQLPPEINPIHFAPRAKEPTLLVGGRYDFIGPVETSQEPLLRLLGAPDRHKRLALFETGHVVYPGPEMIREVLDWFDRYLGPVRVKTVPSRP
jgi:formylglycine-generating enzyme required for sulfatase activity